jgi:SNF2 family DNA or RNA helicase
MLLKLPLTDNQKEDLKFSLAHPYSILALPMGYGKTALAIAIKASLKKRCLVVCPSGLTLNWKKEIQKFLDGQSIKIIKSSKDIEYPFDEDFVILPNSLVHNAEVLFEWAEIVVADEAHCFKALRAKRTEKFHKFVYENNINRLYLLTGTPIKNRVEEYYSLIALCNYNPRIKDPEFLNKFPDSITFADRYSYRTEFEKYMENSGKVVKIVRWDGLKNQEELKSHLHKIYTSRKSSFGPTIRKNVLMSEAADRALLDSFLENIDTIGDGVMPDAKRDAAVAKIPFTISYVEGLLEEVEKVVVLSDHVIPATEIATHFKTTALTGSMSTDRRMELIDRFQNGTDRVLVGTIPVLKEGYTLTASYNMVFNDYCWVPGDISQCEARINRTGQTMQCVSHRILGSPQDGYILDTIEEKLEVINSLYGG